MKPKFLLLALLWCSIQMEKKQHQQQSHLTGKKGFNSLKNIVSILFTFALAFTMWQVSGNYIKTRNLLMNPLFSGRVRY